MTLHPRPPGVGLLRYQGGDNSSPGTSRQRSGEGLPKAAPALGRVSCGEKALGSKQLDRALRKYNRLETVL